MSSSHDLVDFLQHDPDCIIAHYRCGRQNRQDAFPILPAIALPPRGCFLLSPTSYGTHVQLGWFSIFLVRIIGRNDKPGKIDPSRPLGWLKPGVVSSRRGGPKQVFPAFFLPDIHRKSTG